MRDLDSRLDAAAQRLALYAVFKAHRIAVLRRINRSRVTRVNIVPAFRSFEQA